jgi:hypothetical protein
MCTLALALVVGSCGASAPRARRPGSLAARERPQALRCEPTESPRVCALATLDDSAGEIEVVLRLEPNALPAERHDVSLAFAEGVELEAPLPTSLGPVRDAIEVQYRVALDTAAPVPGASFRHIGGWHLVGRTFLPEIVVDGTVAEVPATLRIEGSGQVWTSAGERRIYDAPSLGRLADEAYEVGRTAIARREIGDVVLWVAGSEGAPEAAADALALVLRSLARRLGPPPTDGILVALHASDDSEFAERVGSTVVLVRSRQALLDPIFGAAGAAAPALARLWTPGVHAIAEDWLEEGVSDYFAALATAELTQAPSAALARVVLRSHARYASAGTGGVWTRDAGLVVGFCLDAHLRESGSSLGAALRTTLSRDERSLGAEAFLEDLAAVSPASASYLAALLASDGAFAMDECMERCGLAAREVIYEGWTDDALALALGIEPDDVRPMALTQAFEIEAVREGSALEVGDVVTMVEGERVAEWGELAWALREVHAGGRARLVVRRRGESQLVEVRIAPNEDRREERVFVELVEVVDRARAVAP